MQTRLPVLHTCVTSLVSPVPPLISALITLYPSLSSFSIPPSLNLSLPSPRSHQLSIPQSLIFRVQSVTLSIPPSLPPSPTLSTVVSHSSHAPIVPPPSLPPSLPPPLYSIFPPLPLRHLLISASIFSLFLSLSLSLSFSLSLSLYCFHIHFKYCNGNISFGLCVLTSDKLFV